MDARRATTLVAAACASAACWSSGSASEAAAVSRVDNPWFPLPPGAVWIYRGVKDGQASRDVVRVLDATRVIDGVRCRAVSDRLFLHGRRARRMVTKEWTPLEPLTLDHKLYARGTGLVSERTVKGNDERATLESVRRR